MGSGHERTAPGPTSGSRQRRRAADREATHKGGAMARWGARRRRGARWGPCRCQAAWEVPSPRSWVEYGISARDAEGRPAAWSGAWVCDVCYRPIIEIRSKAVRPAGEEEVAEAAQEWPQAPDQTAMRPGVAQIPPAAPPSGGGPLERVIEELRRLGAWPSQPDPPLEPEDEREGTCGRCAQQRPLHRRIDAGGAPIWLCETCGAGQRK